MKRSSPVLLRRAAARGPSAIEPHLRAYSAISGAALATTAGIVGTVATASAQITTMTSTTGIAMNPAATTGKATHSYLFAPVQLQFYGYRSHNGHYSGKVEMRHVGGDSFAASAGGKLLNLAPGAAVAGLLFEPNGIAFATGQAPGVGVNPRGSFVAAANGVDSGYAGFKFNHNGHSYFGWLHLQITADSNDRPLSIALTPGPNTGSVTGAYAQGAINAGQITAIPEPASVATGLALFALGAAGLREHRRRKTAA